MPNVLILATSKSIDNLRPDFHPPTCFNEAIKIDIPTRQERASILRAITRKMTLTSSNAIDDMASMTEGQTPSHLLLICKRTVLSHLNELLSNFDLNNPSVRLDDLHDIAVGQGTYSSQAARNKKKKSKAGDGSKKESRLNNLDPFGDILSQQGNDNNSDDDDNDNDNDEDNYMFPVNNNNNMPSNTTTNANSNRSSINPFNQMSNAQQGDMTNKNDNDAMFGFGINAQKDGNLNGSTTDIFGAAPTQLNDPFAPTKGTDPFSVPGSSSTTGFPMNDPFSTPGIGGSSSTAAAAAAAVAGNGYGLGNPYNNSTNNNGGHHKKRESEDGKKHKKHKKHGKGKRDESQSQSMNTNTTTNNSNSTSNASGGGGNAGLNPNQQIPQNPFNTASLSAQSNAASNDDPFSQPKHSSVDPFASPSPSSNSAAAAAASNVDPFSQPKSSSKASVDPFADPFSTPSPSAAQKRVMISQNSDPFAVEASKKPSNDGSFTSLAAMPRNPNRANNSDPFAPSNGNRDTASNAADPFAPVLKRGGRASDPFAPSSVRNKSARESIDPFAPPSKK